MIKRIRLNKKKGFTLIELIVVIAIVAILVLLAVPRFIGQTEKAKMTQIQNDIRVVEGKLNAVLVGKPDTLKEWEPAETTELTELVSENKLMGRGGPALAPPMGDVWVIDEVFLDEEVSTKLNGDFFVDADGNVFYEHNKAVAGDNDETPPKPSEKPIPDYYVQATNTDFTKDSEGNWRYTGSDDYVILPHEINGVPLTSYRRMFQGTPSHGVTSSPVKGVVSTNPNVTDMYAMFADSQATTLDLSVFDTSQVTTMSDMFSYAEAPTLDLSSFDTAKVTNMNGMFYVSQATTLDLSSFDTSQVTNMSWMFASSKAATLDLSSFDTANVTDMGSMFWDSNATVGIARTTSDANSFNSSRYKPAGLTFTAK